MCLQNGGTAPNLRKADILRCVPTNGVSVFASNPKAVAQETCQCTFGSRSVFDPESSEPFSVREIHSQHLAVCGHHRPFSFAYFTPHKISETVGLEALFELPKILISNF